MKNVLCVVLWTLILISGAVLNASATETVWTIITRAGSGGTHDAVQGSGSEAWAASRTGATTYDDPMIRDPEDGSPPPPAVAPTAFASWYRPQWGLGTFSYPWAFSRDTRTPLAPDAMIKEWADLIVWAVDGYTAPNIVLFISGAGVPNTVAGQKVAYKLVMTYAPEGYVGPTEWLLGPAPGGSAKTPWTTITLPNLGGKTNPVEGTGPFAAVQTSGYRFTLVTPEPGSLLALGAGLSGFLGLAHRRRK